MINDVKKKNTQDQVSSCIIHLEKPLVQLIFKITVTDFIKDNWRLIFTACSPCYVVMPMTD